MQSAFTVPVNVAPQAVSPSPLPAANPDAARTKAAADESFPGLLGDLLPMLGGVGVSACPSPLQTAQPKTGQAKTPTPPPDDPTLIAPPIVILPFALALTIAPDPTVAPAKIDAKATPTVDAPILAALTTGIKVEPGTLGHAELAFAALVIPNTPADTKKPELPITSALGAAIKSDPGPLNNAEPAIAAVVIASTPTAPNKLQVPLEIPNIAVQPETLTPPETTIASTPQLTGKPPAPAAEVLPLMPIDAKPQAPDNPPPPAAPDKSDVAAVHAASAPAVREETRDGNSQPHSAPEAMLAPAHAATVNSTQSDAEAPAHAPITHAPEVQSEPGTTKNEPMRDISLKLTSHDAERVEVRLTERSGELRVAVRSADPVLTRDLRSGLGDLVSRLERSGFRTETWQPSTTEQRSLAQTARQQQGSQGGNSGDPNQQQSRQDAPGQQRNRRRDQPKWLQEMHNNLNPTEPTRPI